MPETDLLNDFTNDAIPADKGVRFANLIIDTIAVYIVAIFVGFLMAMATPEMFADDSAGKSLAFNLIFFTLYVLYFALFEGLTNGKTLGKFITKTRVIKEDGSEFTMVDSFKRGLSRAVPFEAFSGFSGRLWHDKSTDTIVIKEYRV